jgi:predicted Co/Zn/Cd cation transporter (cation efflux family)
VETIGALVGCGAALAIGLMLGYRWTLGPPWHLIAGLVVGAVCAAIYFAVANWVGRASPGMLNARQVGVHFMVLMIAAPLVGAFGASFGYRKSLGRGLF